MNTLTPETIRAVISMLTPEEKQTLVDKQWEFIPDGDFTMDEKIGFIAAAVPRACNYSAKQLVTIFKVSCKYPANPRDYPYNRPALYHRLESNNPDTLRRLIDMYRPHKHVPNYILKNDMWVGLNAIAAVIDDIYLAVSSTSRSQTGDPYDAIAKAYREPGTKDRVTTIVASDDALAKACEAYIQTITSIFTPRLPT